MTNPTRDRRSGGLSFVLAGWLLLAGGAAAEADRCTALARTPWPLTAAGRADLLQRLEAQRETCVEQADFLALLGALWLEQGQPTQALIWLERALLLRPAHLGAQLDHALALTALGEPAAARQLLDLWQQRADVPPAVLQRLRAALQPVAVARPGAVEPARESTRHGLRWAISGSLAGGRDTNLDRSPSLSEIRLTPPEGPITLPLAIPIAPKKGNAGLAELAVQTHYATATDVLWQSGLMLNERRAKSELEADQRSIQWVMARWHQIGASLPAEGSWMPAWLATPWRIQNQFSWGRSEGTATDAHQQLRYLISAESDWRLGPGQCTRRLDVELARQAYPAQSVLNSLSSGLGAAFECRRLNGARWTWALNTRLGVDRPLSPDRPGGRQIQFSLGARLGLEWRDRWATEWSVRGAELQDRDGFSPLLDNGAPRSQSQIWLSWEGSYRLPGDPGGRQLELWLQWQHLRQTSNIELFRYNADAVYAGLRWRL